MLKLLLAVLLFVILLGVGMRMLRVLARGLPPPPPEGEMRRVNRRYKCSLCGAEVRMTQAAEESPEAPRHCMEDMDLVSTGED